MGMSQWIGFIIACASMGTAIIMQSKTPMVYFNLEAIIIIPICTFAAALLCFPFKTIIHITKVVFTKGARNDYQALIAQVVELANKSRMDRAQLRQEFDNIKDPFLKDGIQMILDGMGDEEIRLYLETRVTSIYTRYLHDASLLKTISKFPPAFGMVGTLIGLISLLQNLGGGGNAMGQIGPAMGMALVATFYGIVLANLFILPMGENLANRAQNDKLMRRIATEGIILIKQRKSPIVIIETLNSYLLPKERFIDKNESSAQRAAA